MAKTVQFEGSTHQFPDDASDEEIRSTLESAHPQEKSKPSGMEQYLSQVNPVSQSQGLVNNVLHPVKAIQAWAEENEGMLHKATEAFKSGQYSEGLRHSLGFLLNSVPGMGTQIDKAGDKVNSGDYTGAAADTAALATNILEGKMLPSAVEGAVNAPSAIAKGARVAAKVVTDPNVVKSVVRVIPKGQAALDAFDTVSGALDKAKASEAAPAPTPSQPKPAPQPVATPNPPAQLVVQPAAAPVVPPEAPVAAPQSVPPMAEEVPAWRIQQQQLMGRPGSMPVAQASEALNARLKPSFPPALTKEQLLASQPPAPAIAEAQRVAEQPPAEVAKKAAIEAPTVQAAEGGDPEAKADIRAQKENAGAPPEEYTGVLNNADKMAKAKALADAINGTETPAPKTAPAPEPKAETPVAARGKGIKQAQLDAEALASKAKDWGFSPDEVGGMDTEGWNKLAFEAGVPVPSPATRMMAKFNLVKKMVGPEKTPSQAFYALKESFKTRKAAQ